MRVLPSITFVTVEGLSGVGAASTEVLTEAEMIDVLILPLTIVVIVDKDDEAIVVLTEVDREVELTDDVAGFVMGDELTGGPAGLVEDVTPCDIVTGGVTGFEAGVV